jgi:hypothetical protein
MGVDAEEIYLCDDSSQNSSYDQSNPISNNFDDLSSVANEVQTNRSSVLHHYTRENMMAD